jgi:MFS transporter, UMF1 family
MSKTAGLLERLGMHRRELRAWAMYDWANSAFMTTVIAAIFPIFFASEAAAGLDSATALSRYSWASTLAVLAVAVMTPVLGAMADYSAMKKKMLGAFLLVGTGATAAMYLIARGQWLFALALFVLANIGAFGSMAFYDSLLPHIASQEEADRVSSAGYAVGYLGGGLLLALNLALIQWPATWGLAGESQAARLSFLSVAVWWLLFSVPIFRTVPEPPRALEADEHATENPVTVAVKRVHETFGELRTFRQAFLLLVAFAIYNDGINTIIRVAVIYGSQIGVPSSALVTTVLMIQFVGVPFTFLFGMMASRVNAKSAIFLSLVIYTVISILGFFLNSTWQFYALGFLVATVQGGSQALSRSMFATMIPRHKSSEFFAFFGIFEKFTGVLGPTIFGWVVAVTGSGRPALLSIIPFFVVGGGLLAFVNVEEGRRAAREAEASVRVVGSS